MRSRAIPVLLVLYALINSVMALVLGGAFAWPAILDEPAAVVLPAFAAEQDTIVAGFYLMTIASVLLLPISLALHRAAGTLAPHREAGSPGSHRETGLPASHGGTGERTVIAFGVLSGVVQTLGWIRWPLVVPSLSDAWAAAPDGSVDRQVIAGDFDTLNLYAGGALGEHLGWLFQSLWAIGIAWWLLRGGSRADRLLGVTGLGLSALWAAAFLLPVFAPTVADGLLGTAGFTAYGLWFLWLVALAVRVWRTGTTLGARPTAPVLARPVTV
ncbi:hypothetical protein Ait01nite_049730 [Actinoplanes italicus]|uniref:Uncharacterized protein DUF4386 n=1 Tax=Actinoplanes italicus TaxID=113567 RepID=A0A2T0KAB6_9ACTN|nr:DUF4386 family protein [Actinoplanes italicus]PRX20075.1 uncharacterized protein DUF4386 [Actinoplanes italicus]GIE31928.1 hypothetical protein Ait01nite_049730 [Actinoplanes italicus]